MGRWIFCMIFALFLNESIGTGMLSHHYQSFHNHDRFVNPNTICGNTPRLSSDQSHLCSQRPHSVASAIQGMHIAIHECKEQFKNHRWNCSALESRNQLPQSSAFLTHASGNRETAFSYAIASAGVVHQVAHACSLGKIEECECPQSQPSHMTASQRKEFHLRNSFVEVNFHQQLFTQKQFVERRPDLDPPHHSFERAGCNHNINYGLEFAVMFLDSSGERDFVSQVKSHNNRVGRLIVSNNMKETCRCHGTSGSCSQKTCWRETPDFKAVGRVIKEKYKTAVKVLPHVAGNSAHGSNSVSERAHSASSSFNVEDLLYFDHSPSYCSPNRRLNVAGTHGRYCNHTAGLEEPNSCENLCCSRGHTIHTVKRVEQCRCKFHWCCYVDCEQCEWEETVAVCN